ncbi:hypothetical protein [Halalkalicoccus salilacus]|uniref:hypothetical protein n=1 Tax=Halalkalicoccus salilacus TaxID=3117459 RepID=UPI00300EEB64
MTNEAGRIYNRARRSGTSSEEAWLRLQELADEVDWDTQWLDEEAEAQHEQV